MIEKTISFKNFKDVPVTKTYFFNLSAAEVTELAMTREGIDEYLREIIKTQETAKLWGLFRELLEMAVGKLVNDEVFTKSPEIRSEFLESGAWDEFFFELIGDAAFAAAFIKGMMPADLQERIDKLVANGGEIEKQYTDLELLTVPDEEFYKVAGGRDFKDWSPRFQQIAYRRKVSAA
ncbi:MAG TPA: hypothetical protein VNA32_08795 [Actinomycetota bacterium]|nr:hypothetical protein [Actinomycetota bacterium]